MLSKHRLNPFLLIFFGLPKKISFQLEGFYGTMGDLNNNTATHFGKKPGFDNEVKYNGFYSFFSPHCKT
jgi:hypothetical protein